VFTYKGSQLCMIGYDELTDFPEEVFFFLLSRNRSTCGVQPYIRATTNPNPDSWVASFISWWVNQDTGYAIQERSGMLRWFIRRDEKIHWADTKEELWERFNLQTAEERMEPRSVTFIASSIYDNKELLKVNPQYLGNLKAMAEVERERFLKGNWKIKASAGLLFKRSQVEIIGDVPTDIIYLCRAWDIAATEKKAGSEDPDFTAGVLIGKRKNGKYVVLDVINQRIKAGDVEKLILNTAMADRAKYGHLVRIRIPIDPGAAGKIMADAYVKMLAGFSVKAERVTGSKVTRANPFASQWQNGNVDVLSSDWNDEYFKQLEFFPDGKHDDMVDASSDAFNELAAPKFNLSNLTR
jgi:predicted phage terminase large subunit-like protein